MTTGFLSWALGVVIGWDKEATGPLLRSKVNDKKGMHVAELDTQQREDTGLEAAGHSSACWGTPGHPSQGAAP